MADHQLDASLERLNTSGFLHPESDDRLPTAVNPTTAIRNQIHMRRAHLLDASSDLEVLTASVDRLAAQVLGRSAPAQGAGIETVRGQRDIAEKVNALLMSAQTEVSLLDRPPYATSAPDGMPAPLAVTDLVRRGVRVRAVVDRAGLEFPGRARGLSELGDQGVEIRVATDLPTKLITVDRQVTLLPPSDAADPSQAAVVASDSLLSNALVPLFEEIWERALPIGVGGTEEVADEDGELLTMLAAGLKDEAIARRLDLHVHTVRRRISRLMTSLNAETRFQAGIQAVRRGRLRA
ncbi:helix-turn-helix transcriptional regulator [Streptomyces sp. NBC_00102]|uniref:helix-turn-helix transcriptional regulator n=1 Tax=Streptomyces sp. NBC_00102 TaxID=2975652 RepID=UPI002B1E4F5D|nr:helix-turn-helix transcriptional regulator [Streptomyces sp. NBC_00102]